RLGPGGGRERVAGCAEHADEDLGAPYFSGRTVDHLHGAAGEVDEYPFARRMYLAQRRLQPFDPLAVQIAQPRVAKALLPTPPPRGPIPRPPPASLSAARPPYAPLPRRTPPAARPPHRAAADTTMSRVPRR